MRIDLNPKGAGTPETARPGRSSGRPSSGPTVGAPSGNEDRAEFSVDQTRVQQLTDQVNAMPEVRQQKVEALGRAIRDGSYDVPPEHTAAAMMKELLRSVV